MQILHILVMMVGVQMCRNAVHPLHCSEKQKTNVENTFHFQGVAPLMTADS